MAQSLALIISSVSLAVVGQLLIKTGMSKIGVVDLQSMVNVKGLVAQIIFSPFVAGGLTLYVLSAVVWLIVLSRVDLSFAYPFAGLGYVMVVLLSRLFLKEDVNLFRWMGVILICSGVIFISKS